jgi:hypothetical protein
MPKPKYWGVEPNRNRHGRLRWYFRPDRAKPRVRLPDDYGSPAFEAAWRAAVAGQVLPAPQILPRQGRRASRNSLGWLVSLYLASPAFLGNRASTQRPRRTMLEKLAVAHGSANILDINRVVIQDSMNARRETVHMANAWLGVVNGMFEWATKEQITDPETGENVTTAFPGGPKTARSGELERYSTNSSFPKDKVDSAGRVSALHNLGAAELFLQCERISAKNHAA